MTILVDIDSTITNFGETLLRYLNRLYGTHHRYTNITSYGWFDQTFAQPWLPTEHDYFWDDVKVNPEAVATIESWVQQGHKARLVTASHFNSMLPYKIRKTLEAFNPELINERNIIIAQDKSVICGDIMIDDCVDNLVDFSGVRICYAQPWNKDWSGAFKLDDWEGINSIVQAYYRFPWR